MRLYTVTQVDRRGAGNKADDDDGDEDDNSVTEKALGSGLLVPPNNQGIATVTIPSPYTLVFTAPPGDLGPTFTFFTIGDHNGALAFTAVGIP